MKIQCFHSSSAGNLYSVSDGKTQIMIECGVEFKEIQKCFNFNLSALAGCLITHSHSDHSKSWKHVAKYTDVFMLKETAQELKASGYRVKHYTPYKSLKLGTFLIVPFDGEHDVPCCCFLIRSMETNEMLLFATDTAYLHAETKNLNFHYAMIECNYQLERLNEDVDKGILEPSARSRIVGAHLGLNTALEVLKGINPNTLKEVYALHLSSRHADEKEVRQTIEQAIGKPVYVAGK